MSNRTIEEEAEDLESERIRIEQAAMTLGVSRAHFRKLSAQLIERMRAAKRNTVEVAGVLWIPHADGRGFRRVTLDRPGAPHASA